jgi:hypothetical protein
MNYLIGKDTVNVKNLAPEKEMGRKFKKQKPQWNGNSRQSIAGMGQDPNMNYFTTTVEALPLKGHLK